MMFLHEMSIEEMEAGYDDSKCLLSEYAEVGVIDRIFGVGDDKYYQWIEKCESKQDLLTFIRKMKIVTNPRSSGTTRVNVLIAILEIVLGTGISILFGKAIQPLVKDSGFVIRTGASFATSAAASKASEGIIRRNTDRYLPMIEAAEKRLNELRAQ